MINAGKTLGWVACGLVLCVEANAVTPDTSANPYQGIVDRNIFGLRPPPPPPSNEPVKPPPPAVTLTGITTILGKKLAFMNVQLPPKAGEQAKAGPQSFMLGVGEREGEIEVIEIDEKAGTVKLDDYGVITNVPFAKLPSTPSAGVNTAGILTPNPAQHPGMNPAGAPPQRSIPGLPARPLRVPNQGATGVGAGTSGTAALPGLTGATPATVGNPQQNAPQQAAPPMTAEEDAIMTEVNRELYRSDPRIPPLPPTPITSPQDLQQIMQPGAKLPKGWNQIPQTPQLPQ